MAAVRDRYVWDLAQGKSPAPPDDSATGELIVPPTRFGNPQQHYSEPEELKYLTPEECIKTMKVPEGFEVQPFASEREFPELAKPDRSTSTTAAGCGSAACPRIRSGSRATRGRTIGC